MKMKKKKTIIKISAALLVTLMLLSGCGKKENSSSSAASQPATVSSTTSSEKTESEAGKDTTSSKTEQSAKPEAPSGAVAKSEKVNASYFDDTIFIGDSVTLKLKNYVAQKRKTNSNFLGKAILIPSGSLGSGNALQPISSKSVHPSLNGKKMLIEDAVAKSGAKKVYIMLGMNDIGLYGVDDSVKNMATLLGKIKEKSPDITIIVQSATPMIKEKQHKQLNNPNMLKYDNKLVELCKEKGYYFVNVAEVMRDKDGNLPMEYCSDPNNLGLHFTDIACEKWIDYLFTHAVK